MRRLCLVAAVLAIGTACGSDSPGPRPKSSATIKIVEPQAGAALAAPKVHVRLSLEGGRIVQAATTDLRGDEGHVHLSIDGGLVSQTFALEQDVEVAPGSHLLQAEFVAGDHAPFNPRVLSTSTFTAT